jgi:hypothetical protein
MLFSELTALASPAVDHASRLDKLNELVPGDFIAVRRRLEVLAKTFGHKIDTNEFLSELEREHSLKSSVRPAIGF